jgi:hypothetical protein
MMNSLLLAEKHPIVAERLAGKTYEAIAKTLGVTVGAVRHRLLWAIKNGIVTAQEVRYRSQERRPFLTDEQYDAGWFDRLRARSHVNERGCWIWDSPVNQKGYIVHHHRKWHNMGHRTVYKLTHRVDLETEELVCHDCDDRRCWNPEHLWVGAPADNSLDMVQKGRCHESTVTHCPQGHAYDEQNTYWHAAASGRPARMCRTCQSTRAKSPEYKAKAREREARRRAKNRGVSP